MYPELEYHQLECQGVIIQKRVKDSFVNAYQLLEACKLIPQDKQALLNQLCPRPASHPKPKPIINDMIDEDDKSWHGSYPHVTMSNGQIWIPLESAYEIGKQYGIERELKPFLLNYRLSSTSSIDFGVVSQPPEPLPKRRSSSKILDVNQHHGHSKNNNDNQDNDYVFHVSELLPGQHGATSKSSASKRGISPGDDGNTSSAQGSPNLKKRKIIQVSDTYQSFKDRYRKRNRYHLLWSKLDLLNGNHEASSLSSSHHHRHYHHQHEHGSDSHGLTSSTSRQRGGMKTLSLSFEQKQLLLNIFVDGCLDQVNELLKTPQLDVNMSLDDQGNTSIHWAAALGRLRILRHLMSCGGRGSRMNYAGETPLMRAIHVENNRFNHTFPELLDIMDDALFSVDEKRQSILHHLAYRSGFEKVTAMYYLQCIHEHMQRPSFRSKRHIFVNAKDRTGDTALHIASRVGDVDAIKLLIQMGADQNVKNLAGKMASDCAIPNTLTHQFYFPMVYEGPTVPEESDVDMMVPLSPIDTPVLEVAHFLSFVKESRKQQLKSRGHDEQDALLFNNTHKTTTTGAINLSSASSTHQFEYQVHFIESTTPTEKTPTYFHTSISSFFPNSSSALSPSSSIVNEISRLVSQLESIDNIDKQKLKEIQEKIDEITTQYEFMKSKMTETDSSTPDLTWSSPEQKHQQSHNHHQQHYHHHHYEPQFVQQELEKLKSLFQYKSSSTTQAY